MIFAGLYAANRSRDGDFRGLDDEDAKFGAEKLKVEAKISGLVGESDIFSTQKGRETTQFRVLFICGSLLPAKRL